MMEYIYLWEPRNSDPAAYRSFDDAVKALCENNYCSSLDELIEWCENENVYIEVYENSVYVDDGGRVTRIALR